VGVRVYCQSMTCASTNVPVARARCVDLVLPLPRALGCHEVDAAGYRRHAMISARSLRVARSIGSSSTDTFGKRVHLCVAGEDGTACTNCADGDWSTRGR